ncbi:tryptophan synthase subunit beta [Haloarcula sp. CBA1130]|uniref:tryptophan synthase subunit beta n=1 Tax=unclassified Haloarcula TaxID=2624677 RepID=UPI0012487357|nr:MULTISPECIES: tryptophan synthase subunit beta [unclassified Haloarcula]KAA9396797.1 tryptophan synthase subunit beta [Haloarcula sp. CBA1129]KAA9401758.1 tryptophan synthase subunit beta [Haloarcula sp. CBA1130]
MSTDDAHDPKFGEYGGQYVPEALMPAIEELTDAYQRYVLENEDGFMDEFRERLADFGGRPTPLQYAEQLSARYDTDVYLKREDLLHGGAHKLNNALGQVLLAKYMGKERIIAETGAGQHGTATAMAAAHLDMPCEIYMGETDIARQRPNVFRMRINGSEVNPVTVGRGTLKEAISETMRDWATTVENTHYVIGSVVGPHPFPKMVRDFQAVISEEAREQTIEKTGSLPDSVIACAGGGSNTMGTFAHFVEDDGEPRSPEQSSSDEPRGRVDLYAVEAGGSSLQVDEEEGVAPNSATLSTGDEGVLHGARTKLLQDSDGQIMESHSVSAGLDYAGVGPELAHLVDEDRVTPVNVDDDTALEAFHRLSQDEGIIPALETAHAFGYLEEHHDEVGDTVVVNVSGRGDKDLETVIEETSKRDLDIAPDMSIFERVGGGGL